MADPTFEKPVCFVATDPSYCVALDAIAELRDTSNERLKTEDGRPVKVGNSQLLHSKKVKEGSSEKKAYTNKYNRLYDFSRTLGAVLRAFMLTATGLIKYYHPDIGDSEGANLTHGENGFYVEVNGKTQNFATPKKKGQESEEKKLQGQLISGNFDRLYPHILIEKKLEDARLKEVSFPGRMLIVDMGMENTEDPGITFHQISTTVRFQKQESEGDDHVINCPHPSVKYTSERVLPGKDGPKFKLLKAMISRYPEIVERWESYDPQPKNEENPGTQQPKKEADQGTQQPNKEADQGTPQPNKEADQGTPQPEEQAAPGTPQPEEQAAPGGAQPKDEKEE